jgi:hypothetical protein
MSTGARATGAPERTNYTSPKHPQIRQRRPGA